ncbi:MAG: PAS domain S-box protein [Desulfobaccales bacterium]
MIIERELKGNIPGLLIDKAGKTLAKERLRRFNECFLSLGTDPEQNINRLVALCGELLGGTCALYNRLEGSMLCSVGQWNTPADYDPISSPQGHICYDVIQRDEVAPMVVRHLSETSYAQTDPNVRNYNLQTYIGYPVKFGAESIGSLCVVYQEDVKPDEDDLKLIGAIATAISIEENRRLAAKELRETIHRYRLLVETMSEGLALADVNYVFAYVNNRFCEMLGYQREELIGHHFTEFVSDDYQKFLKKQIAKRKSGQAERYELAWVGKNGRKIYTLISPKGLYDTDGSFIGSLGVLTDISDRKQAEEALQKARDELERRVKRRTSALLKANEELLREINERLKAEEALKQSERRYRLLAENISDVIWTIDINLEITYVSPSIEHLLGLNTEEAMKQGTKKILTPSSLQLAQKVITEEMENELREIKDLTRSRTLELELFHNNGSRVWVEVRASFLRDPAGNPTGILGVSRDITERKQAEDFSKDLFEKSPIGLYIIHSGRFQRLNPASQLITGFPPGELLGREWSSLIHRDDREKVRENAVRMLKRESISPFEYRIITKSGDTRWIMETITSTRYEGRRAALGHAMDVTESHWSMEELRKSETRLRHLAAELLTAQEKERKRISRELHDEMGQSLLALKMQLKAIEKELPITLWGPRQDCLTAFHYIDRVIENVRRLSRDLSPSILEDVGLGIAIKRLFEDFCKLNELRYSLEIDDIDGLFSANAKINIYRILQESLTNIGKYSKAAKVTACIKREEDRVDFWVEDDGKGFDPSQVLANTVGRGLGLASMEERAQILGGAINIWSQEGKGTKISFTVPIGSDTRVDRGRGGRNDEIPA